MRGRLDARTLRRFLELAGERLTGDWVVIGGSVLPILGIEQRVTVDIDVAGPTDAGVEATVTLLDIAAELGLPVEAVNQAAAYFLRRVPKWEDHLVEVHRGRRGVIRVPDTTLFTLLKVGRLTEADLSDCLALIARARKRKEPVDAVRIRRAVREARRTASPGKSRRLDALLAALEAG